MIPHTQWAAEGSRQDFSCRCCRVALVWYQELRVWRGHRFEA